MTDRIPRLKRMALVVGAVAVAVASSFALARYLAWRPWPLVWLASSALVLLAWRQRPFRDVGWRPIVVFGCFAALLDLSIVLGRHLVITAHHMYGHFWENYISPYSIVDIAAFAAIFPAVFTFAFAPFAFAVRERRGEGRGAPSDADMKHEIQLRPISRKWLWGGALFVFLLWVPYLLAYWPGFIFGDTMWSINQALGITTLNDHHPVAYTGLFALCFAIAHALGFGNTAGCALVTIAQMVFMAYCFSYSAQWIVSRGRLHWLWGALILLLFGLVPSMAVYSVAMWKDPVFSVAVMVLSLLLFDYARTRGRIVSESRYWIPSFTVLLALAFLFRSNGRLIVIALAIAFVAIAIVCRANASTSRPARTVAIAASAVAVAGLVFTGPVSTALGVEKMGTSEGAGILYNQMARVVAYDGDYSEENAEFLDSLLPLERYPYTYRPGSFDELKYAFQENGAYFGMRALLQNWVSMLVKNPGLYLEAWELQTFGFWAVNDFGLAEFANIAGGVPRNTTQDDEGYLQKLSDDYGIHVECKLPGDASFWRAVFPQDSWSPPAGLLFWLTAYLGCLCVALGKGRWILSLAPTLLLFFSMFIATPICYWQRYVAAAYFLIPFFAFMLYMLMTRSSNMVVSATGQTKR